MNKYKQKQPLPQAQPEIGRIQKLLVSSIHHRHTHGNHSPVIE